MIPAPLEGEWLWDESLQTWLPLVKTDTGLPDVDATLAAGRPPEIIEG